MSDTPRTDEHAARMHAHSKRWDFEYRYEGEISTPWPDGLLSDHDFARTLERELAAVTAERDAMRDAVAHIEKVIGKQLELIAARAHGDYLNKGPVVNGLGLLKRRAQDALRRP